MRSVITRMQNIISVSKLNTYGIELSAVLTAKKEQIKRYFDTETENFRLHNLSRKPGQEYKSLWEFTNPFAEDFNEISECIRSMLDTQTILTWHYTRLTDTEVQDIQENGIELSTFDTMKSRLSRIASSGELQSDWVDEIIQSSPLQSREQYDARNGRFWAVTCPIHHSSSLVELLLNHWGGEVVYFWQKEETIVNKLGLIGKARICEIAIPVSMLNLGSIKQGVLKTFAKSLGCQIEPAGTDVYIEQTLPGSAVMRVYTEGEEDFRSFGNLQE